MATPAPTPPGSPPALPVSTDAESTFDTLWDAFNAWLKNNLWPYLGAVADSTEANATEAEAAAATATAQASAALASVNAPKWVSGTNYAADVCAWSPSDKQTYRRNAPGGVSTTDPSLDTTGWTRVSGGDALPQFLLMAQGIK